MWLNMLFATPHFVSITCRCAGTSLSDLYLIIWCQKEKMSDWYEEEF